MSRLKSNHGKATAFWLELVLSLCAMMICGCICLVVFVQADRASKLSRAETEALLRLQSVAEQFKVAPSSPSSEWANGVRYDASWAELSGESGAVYQMEVALSEKDGIAQASLTMKTVKDGQALCTLNVKKYLPERGMAS